MNGDNLHPYIEPELEARIVALVLGEASDFEREDLERLIAESPELVVFRKRIETMHRLLREVAKGESENKKDEWKLSDERRTTVLAAIDGAPAKTAKDVAEIAPNAIPVRSRWSGLLKIAAIVCILALGAFLFFPAADKIGFLAQRSEEDAVGGFGMWGIHRSAPEADAATMPEKSLEGTRFRWAEAATEPMAQDFKAVTDGVADSIDLNMDPEVIEFDGMINYSKPRAFATIAAASSDPRATLKQLEDTLGMPGLGDETDSRDREVNDYLFIGQAGKSLTRDHALAAHIEENTETMDRLARIEVPMPVLAIEDKEEAENSMDLATTTYFRTVAPEEVRLRSVEVDDDGKDDAGRSDALATGQVAGNKRMVQVQVPEADEAVVATAESAPMAAWVATDTDTDSEAKEPDVPILGDVTVAGRMFKAKADAPMPAPAAPAPVPSAKPAPQPVTSLGVNGSFEADGAVGGGGGGGQASTTNRMERRLTESLGKAPVEVRDAFGIIADESGSLYQEMAGAERADAEPDGSPLISTNGKAALAFPSDKPTEIEAGSIVTVTGGALHSAGEDARKNLGYALGPVDSGATPDTTRATNKAPAPITKQPMARFDKLAEAKTALQPEISMPEIALRQSTVEELDDIFADKLGTLRGMDSKEESSALATGTAGVPVSGLAEADSFAEPEQNFARKGQTAMPTKAREQLKLIERKVELQRGALKDSRTSYESKLKDLGELEMEDIGQVTESLIEREEAALEESARLLDSRAKKIAALKKRKLVRAPVRRTVAPPAGLDEKNAAEEAFSTFSLHVSDVSFKLAQAALAKGEWPEADRIRIEEFVNAFDYGDPMPGQQDKVACRVEQSTQPFLQQRNLLRVSMRTAEAGRANSTPLRLTFLLDNSGSMERVDRQETVRRAFALLAAQLQPIDQVTLISFARQPRLLADRVGGERSTELVDIVANVPSEGGTNLEAALNLAFEKAREQQEPNAQNRVILLTDGAANLGDAEPESLSRMIESMRDGGIAFDAAGIGADGLNDEILEALTRKGDGRYYLLDRPEDADAGFARQIAGALRPAASNVKVQVEFNPDRVGRYKLLGFEKHRLNKEDFRDDSVDAAEMAPAEAGVAVYQIEPLADGEGDVGSVSVRFRDMTSGQMVEKRWPIFYEPGAAHPDHAEPSMRIATAASLFAAKLKGGPLGETVDLGELAQIVSGLPERYRNQDRVQDLQQMIEQARDVASASSR